MKEKNFKLFLFLILFLSIQSVSFSQTDKPSSKQWSLMLMGNFNTNFGVSTAMQGNFSEFYSDNYQYGDVRQFPVNDPSMSIYLAGVQLAYRFPESSFSLYSNMLTNFLVINSKNAQYTTPSGIQTMSTSGTCYISTFALGCEYSMGDRTQLWNIFGRLGLNVSAIYGTVADNIATLNVVTNVRSGFEAEFGGRLNIPSTPLALELSANYCDYNLIGKRRISQSNLGLFDIDLQDSQNPQYPNIKSKTIDFLSLRIGIRIWL